MNLERYISFKQGYSKHLGKAPHKPILVLALIEAIDKGFCVSNEFPIMPELVGLFRGYWNQLVKSGHSPNFALPFFHLQNEKSKVWEICTLPGFENVLTTSHSVKSLSTLSTYVKYGKLADEFFTFLLEKTNREIAKARIIEKYFGLSEKSFYDFSVDYLQEINSQILNEPPDEYSGRIIKLKCQAKEIIEEESFMREAAFKKLIPQLYNNTCAISGMRINTTLNGSMIDACHIVPWAEGHDDTVTNGISLSPNLHRAFDRGLIAIDNDYRVIVSDRFEESESPYNIWQFNKMRILLPETEKYRPSRENLEDHRKRWGFG